MTDSENIKTVMSEVVQQQQDLVSSAYPYFKEFHSFVSFTREAAEYIQCDYPLPPVYDGLA